MNPDFFVLRMPLLPLDALERASDGLTAPAALNGSSDQALQTALDEDHQRARERIRERLADPRIARAIHLASPDLTSGLRHWSRDPDGGRGRSVERSLVSYLTRMSARPALFGLFAGYAIGQLGTPGPACLSVSDRDELRVRAHLDTGWLGDLQFAAAAKARTSESLLLRRDPGLYEAVGQLRVAVGRDVGERVGRCFESSRGHRRASAAGPIGCSDQKDPSSPRRSRRVDSSPDTEFAVAGLLRDFRVS